MDIAALILSILSLLVGCSTLIIYLSKNVFSSHVVQLVSAESIGNPGKAKPMGEDFEEFDHPSAMDAVIDQNKQN